MTERDSTATHVAIIGMAGRLPGARTIAEYWRNLCDGVESIRPLSADEMIAAGLDPAQLEDPHHVPAGALIDDVDRFDASFFGVSGREAELMDPQQRLFLQCAWEALEDAGCDPARFDGAIGTFGGANFDSYLTRNLLPADVFEDKASTLQTILSNDKDYLATRVAYKLNLRGPAFTVQSGCSTSLLAVHLACHSLLNFECDLALAGGVAVDLGRAQGYWAHEGSVYAPDGHCRPFAAEANGTVFGNGVAIVVLKRLADALSDGDTISAVVIGSAVNNDGAVKVGFTAPSVSGQASVIAEALADAGVQADSIGYVEAHGTGTPLGDPIEVEALTRAFGRRPPGLPRCAIGSVKSNVGHLDSAAGAAGLIKAALALRHHVLPASLHVVRENPKIAFDSTPFVVNRQLTPWTAGTRAGQPRRAGVSSFGMGGTNVHVVLQEAPGEVNEPANRAPQLLVWSARTPDALDEITGRLRAALAGGTPSPLADIAFTLQTGRTVFAHRRMLAAESHADALAALASADASRVRTHHHDGTARGVAFLLPGQGSQRPGMGADLYDGEPEFRAAFDECRGVVRTLTGEDLVERVCRTRPGGAEADALLRTELAQPALFAVEYALARLWMAWGIRPAAMIGHSLGELVAACLAGVFPLADAMRLVVARGRLMQQQPPGAMTAVAAGPDDLALSGSLGVAAMNAERATVVSGPSDEIERFEAQLTGTGIAWRRLRTSHAFHSSMMAPAMQAFAEAFDGVRLSPPAIPFISNVTGRWIEAGEATNPYYWAEHLRQPVRFADGLRCLLADGPFVLLEVGPGHALTTLARQPRQDAPVRAVASLPDPSAEASPTVQILDALGQLWQAGCTPDWPAVHGGRRRRRVPLPTYPFERARHWIDPPADDETTSQESVLKRIDDPARWLYVPGWSRTPPVELVSRGTVDPAVTEWLVLADDSALSRFVVARLRAAAADRVTVVRAGPAYAGSAGAYTLDPRSVEDYRRLIASLGEAGRRPSVVVHLWSASERAEDATTAAAVGRAQDRGAFSLIALMQALGAGGTAGPLALRVVTSHVCDVLGTEPLAIAASTVHGVLRVIAQELPHVDCRCIDVDVAASAGGTDAETVAGRLVAELHHRVPEPFVAYRGPGRWAPVVQPLASGGPPGTRLRREGTYVVLGGLGRIGLTLAEHLARSAGARIVLVGRTPLPARGEWSSWLGEHPEADPVSQRIRRVLDIENAGGEVLVVAADVSDLEALERAFAAGEERFGAIHGVISAAGIVSGAFHGIASLTSEECERQFRPKVDGSFALEAVLAERRPDFCLLVSSLSSVLGGLGYGAYAAANAFMDAFTRRLNRRAGVRWVSANWDAWRWTAVDPKAPHASLVRLAMLPEEAAQVFDAVVALAGHADQVLISTTNLPRRIAEWVEDIGGRSAAALAPTPAVMPLSAAAAGREAPAPTAAGATVADARDLTPTQRAVVEVWAEVLKLPTVELTDGFLDIGGSSLTAVHAISRIQTRLGVHVAIEEFIFQTAGQLASLCDRKLAQSPPVRIAEPSADTPSTRGRESGSGGLLRGLRSAVTGKR